MPDQWNASIRGGRIWCLRLAFQANPTWPNKEKGPNLSSPWLLGLLGILFLSFFQSKISSSSGHLLLLCVLALCLPLHGALASIFWASPTSPSSNHSYPSWFGWCDVCQLTILNHELPAWPTHTRSRAHHIIRGADCASGDQCATRRRRLVMCQLERRRISGAVR